MTKLTKGQQADKEWAEKFLRGMFDPVLAAGKKPEITTVLKHCSQSGMRREIMLLFATSDGIVNLNQAACALMQDKCGKHDGIIINGCGMDMGFSLVYNMGRTLYGNDCGHVHGTRNSEPDKDGGYALVQRWA